MHFCFQQLPTPATPRQKEQKLHYIKISQYFFIIHYVTAEYPSVLGHFPVLLQHFKRNNNHIKSKISK